MGGHALAHRIVRLQRYCLPVARRFGQQHSSQVHREVVGKPNVVLKDERERLFRLSAEHRGVAHGIQVGGGTANCSHAGDLAVDARLVALAVQLPQVLLCVAVAPISGNLSCHLRLLERIQQTVELPKRSAEVDASDAGELDAQGFEPRADCVHPLPRAVDVHDEHRDRLLQPFACLPPFLRRDLRAEIIPMFWLVADLREFEAGYDFLCGLGRVALLRRKHLCVPVIRGRDVLLVPRTLLSEHLDSCPTPVSRRLKAQSGRRFPVIAFVHREAMLPPPWVLNFDVMRAHRRRQAREGVAVSDRGGGSRRRM
mmetsp:Transcript_40496/g.111501  ORF Transcript_40496/g.111501 Transcript_40496/m.111501 type:complete len:312 (-) Transcript_40496:308-1243(-)